MRMFQKLLIVAVSVGVVVACGDRVVQVDAAKEISNEMVAEPLFSESTPLPILPIIQIAAETNKVQFLYRNQQGKQAQYRAMIDQAVTAEKCDNDHYRLLYKGVEIGATVENGFVLCGREYVDALNPASEDVTMKAERYKKACSVNFYNYAELTEEGYAMDLGLAHHTGSLNLVESDGYVDLSAFAQPQISQRSTGTCLFNSSTGILEILAAMEGSQGLETSVPDFSEPFMVKFMSQKGSRHNTIVEGVNVSGVVDDSVLSRHDLYKKGKRFSSVKKAPMPAGWQMEVQELAGEVVSEPIFWLKKRVRNWRGRMVTRKRRIREAEFEQMIDWLQTHQRPIQLHHYVGRIWHVVILLGYNPETKEVLIKDSLGNENLKGTWRSYHWVMKKSKIYGANGVYFK